LTILLLVGSSRAQDEAAPDAGAAGIPAQAVEATHEQLRSLKTQAETAFNKIGQSGRIEDLQPLLDLVTEDVVLAAMNGEVVVGKDGITKYFQRTMASPDHTVASVHHDFKVAELTTLYGGDTGVAHGTSKGKYDLTDGMTFEADVNWTATMVRENDRWLLASFQFGPSIFDNPVLDMALSAMYRAVVIAGLVGLGGGFLLGWALRRRPAVS